MTEAEHTYGGDVGEDPTQVPVPEPQHLAVMAGLATATAVPGQVTLVNDTTGDDGDGVD